MPNFEVSGIDIRKILIFEQKSINLLTVDPCSQNCTTEVMLIFMHTYIHLWKYVQEYSQGTSCERRQPRETS